MRAPTKGGGDFEKPPEGYHKARAIRAIDLGTQEGQWKGNATYKRQFMLMFELPEFLVEFEDKQMPGLVSKKYNLTFSNKATLRKDMESWYGKKFNDKDIEAAGGFDPAKVVGRAAKLQVVYSDDGQYANIGVIIPEDDCPDQVHPSVIIDLDELDMDAWNGLSDNMKGWIMKSPEAQAIFEQGESKQHEAPLEPDDEIPF